MTSTTCTTCRSLITEYEAAAFDGRCPVCARRYFGESAKPTDKAPGEYLVESINVGDLVKPYRRLFASRVERISDHGGSIVLHLEDGFELEQVWGHVVEVVSDQRPTGFADALDRAVDAMLPLLPVPPVPTVDMRPLIPQPWDCRTPSGHHFTVSFSSAEQRDAVESHWLDRHDYCRVCEDCDGCRHPDCGTCVCD